MPTIDILVRRFSVVSQRPFEEIIRGLTATIGGPDIKTFTMGCRGLDAGRARSRGAMGSQILGPDGICSIRLRRCPEERDSRQRAEDAPPCRWKSTHHEGNGK